jgi:hypothetical protein
MQYLESENAELLRQVELMAQDAAEAGRVEYRCVCVQACTQVWVWVSWCVYELCACECVYVCVCVRVWVWVWTVCYLILTRGVKLGLRCSRSKVRGVQACVCLRM